MFSAAGSYSSQISSSTFLSSLLSNILAHTFCSSWLTVSLLSSRTTFSRYLISSAIIERTFLPRSGMVLNDPVRESHPTSDLVKYSFSALYREISGMLSDEGSSSTVEGVLSIRIIFMQKFEYQLVCFVFRFEGKGYLYFFIGFFVEPECVFAGFPVSSATPTPDDVVDL